MFPITIEKLIFKTSYKVNLSNKKECIFISPNWNISPVRISQLELGGIETQKKLELDIAPNLIFYSVEVPFS